MPIDAGYDFASTEEVTADKLRQLIVLATISGQSAGIITSDKFNIARIPTIPATLLSQEKADVLFGTFDASGTLQCHPDKMEVVTYTPEEGDPYKALQIKAGAVGVDEMHTEALDADDAKRPVTKDAIQNGSVTDAKNAWGVKTYSTQEGGNLTIEQADVDDNSVLICPFTGNTTFPIPALLKDGKPILMLLHNLVTGGTPTVQVGNGTTKIYWAGGVVPPAMVANDVVVVSVVNYGNSIYCGDWVSYKTV